MADKASILKSAQKFLAKGQVDKAIVEGEKLVKAYPDSNNFNFLGDLYLKNGDKKKAGEFYHKTAKIYRDEGFSLKALAIYKKVLNLDNTDASALLALGELNEEKNIVADAIKFYLAAADSFFKNKKKEDAVKVYDKILNIAPKNVPLRNKIAETFAKLGLNANAAGEYRGIGELYEEKNDLNKAREFYIKSLDVLPASRLTMLALSRIAEKTGDLEQALNYVKIALERVGEHKDVALRKVHLLIERGETEEAETYLNSLLEKETVDLDVRKAHADFVMRSGDMDKAWEYYDTVLDEMIADGQLDEARAILDKFRGTSPEAVAKKYIIIHKNAEDNDAAFNELLNLADAYRDKGLMQEALATLNEARILKPDNTEVPEKIEEIRNILQPGVDEETEAPAPEPEVEEKKEEFAAGAGLGASLGEDTGIDLGAELGSEFGVEEPFAPPAKEPAEAAPAAKMSASEAMTEIDVFLRYGLYDEARPKLEAMKVEDPNNVEVHQKLKTLYKDTKDTDQAVTECIVLAELFGRSGDQDSRRKNLKEAYDLNPSDPRLEDKLEEIGVSASTATQVTEPAAPTESLDAYQSDLTEADFYSKQGFYQEAAEIYERLHGIFPDNSELMVKLDDMRNSMGSEAPAPKAAAPTKETEEIEGMETLSFDDLLAEAPLPEGGAGELSFDSDVMEVFAEFKKGLEEQVSSEDTETHYNLGIAYREMGLVDDAISTFKAAKNDPNFFVQASTMLGTCYMEKGMFADAVEAFQGVLKKLDPNEETAWSVKYDLADALEQDGKLDEALDYFTQVQGWDSSYREVSDRVDALKKKVGTSDKPAKPKEPTNIDTKRKSRVSYI